MAEHLSKYPASLTMALVFATACAQAWPASSDLPDPTRPPALPGAQSADAQAASPALALQSVLISPQRRTAMISGRTVQVGDRVGDARVVRITESEVTLRGTDGMRILKVFPQIEKRAVHDRTGVPAQTTAK